MTPTISGLIKKRGEIVGRIHALQEEGARLVAALDHLDCTLRLFDPEIDFQDMPVKALPPPNAAFRGEFQRSLLEMLRGQQRWQTTDELTVKVMVQRRMNEADRPLRVLIRWNDPNLFRGDDLERIVSCGHEGELPDDPVQLGYYFVAMYRTPFSPTPRCTAHVYKVLDLRRDDDLIDFRDAPFGEHLKLRHDDGFVGYAT